MTVQCSFIDWISLLWISMSDHLWVRCIGTWELRLKRKNDLTITDTLQTWRIGIFKTSPMLQLDCHEGAWAVFLAHLVTKIWICLLTTLISLSWPNKWFFVKNNIVSLPRNNLSVYKLVWCAGRERDFGTSIELLWINNDPIPIHNVSALWRVHPLVRRVCILSEIIIHCPQILPLLFYVGLWMKWQSNYSGSSDVLIKKMALVLALHMG